MITHIVATMLQPGELVIPVDPEPVATNLTLALVKQHLEYEDSDRDDLIFHYMRASAAWVESYIGQFLTVRTVLESFNGFGSHLALSRGPVLEVTLVEYVDNDGMLRQLTDFQQRGAKIYAPASGWPAIEGGSNIEITYRAGYEMTPADLVSAQLLLIGHWFENREAVTIGGAAVEIPLATEALCQPHRALLI